jgi:hypothetical protein
MTLPEILQAHISGLTVCWANTSYQIKGKNPDNLLVCCTYNNYCTGLTEEHTSECFILTETMTNAQQAEYNALVAAGSITPGTPVVPHTCAKHLATLHGIPNGKVDSNIQIWIDDTLGKSIAVTFQPISGSITCS